PGRRTSPASAAGAPTWSRSKGAWPGPERAGTLAGPMSPALPRRLPDWAWAGLILLAALAAYAPAWNGAFVWDDDGHVTKPELRSLHGLARIWTEPAATQQYYPVLHTAFWIEHRLW